MRFVPFITHSENRSLNYIRPIQPIHLHSKVSPSVSKARHNYPSYPYQEFLLRENEGQETDLPSTLETFSSLWTLQNIKRR